MYRKTTTSRTPRKAELMAALRGFTASVRNAGGLEVLTLGTTKRHKLSLDRAYLSACALLGEQPQPIVTESADDYEAQATHLVNRHARLIELAQKRGYSGRALAGLVLSAHMAEQVKAL